MQDDRPPGKAVNMPCPLPPHMMEARVWNWAEKRARARAEMRMRPPRLSEGGGMLAVPVLASWWLHLLVQWLHQQTGELSHHISAEESTGKGEPHRETNRGHSLRVTTRLKLHRKRREH